jgi:hypothetical protein
VGLERGPLGLLSTIEELVRGGAREEKSKIKSMLIIVFHIKRIVHKEFVLAGHTANSAYYCDVSRFNRN